MSRFELRNYQTIFNMSNLFEQNYQESLFFQNVPHINPEQFSNNIYLSNQFYFENSNEIFNPIYEQQVLPKIEDSNKCIELSQFNYYDIIPDLNLEDKINVSLPNDFLNRNIKKVKKIPKKQTREIITNRRICIEENCKKTAHFNNPGEKIRLYCSEHKKYGMIDIKNKKCQHEDCFKIPCFNFPGQKARLYCINHKKDGMINVKHRKCSYPKCQKQCISLSNTCLEHVLK